MREASDRPDEEEPGFRRRFKQLDDEAWTRFVREHTPLVEALVGQTLGESADVEDVVATIWDNVYFGIGSYDPARPLLPWVCRITLNACYKHLRERKRRKERETAVAALRHEIVADPVDCADLDETVHLAVAELPPREAQVFMLRQMHGKSVEETAEVLCLKRKSVVETFSRAVRNIRNGPCGEALREYLVTVTGKEEAR